MATLTISTGANAPNLYGPSPNLSTAGVNGGGDGGGCGVSLAIISATRSWAGPNGHVQLMSCVTCHISSSSSRPLSSVSMVYLRHSHGHDHRAQVSQCQTVYAAAAIYDLYNSRTGRQIDGYAP